MAGWGSPDWGDSSTVYVSAGGSGAGSQSSWGTGWGNWTAAHSQGDGGKGDGGKGGGKGSRRSVEHANPLDLGPPQTLEQRMRWATTFLNSNSASVKPTQLILQIAGGDRNGNARWMDGPEELQQRFREAITKEEAALSTTGRAGPRPTRSRSGP